MSSDDSVDLPSVENSSSRSNRIRSKNPRHGRPRKVDRHAGKADNPVNVFVKHLPQHINENKLRKLFEKHGDINSVRVMRVSESLPTLRAKRSASDFAYFATLCRI